MLQVETNGRFIPRVGEQGDPHRIQGSRKSHGMLKQDARGAAPPESATHNQIFKSEDQTAMARADSEQKADHGDHEGLMAQHKNAPRAGGVKNEPQTGKLFLPVRLEISLLGEQFRQEIA